MRRHCSAWLWLDLAIVRTLPTAGAQYVVLWMCPAVTTCGACVIHVLQTHGGGFRNTTFKYQPAQQSPRALQLLHVEYEQLTPITNKCVIVIIVTTGAQLWLHLQSQ